MSNETPWSSGQDDTPRNTTNRDDEPDAAQDAAGPAPEDDAAPLSEPARESEPAAEGETGEREPSDDAEPTVDPAEAAAPSEAAGSDEAEESVEPAEGTGPDEGEESAEPHRVDASPVDVGEPEPAVEAPETSTDAVTEIEPPVILPPEPSGPPVGETAGEVAAPVGVAGVAATETPEGPLTPVFVPAPTPPKARGNRWMGILIDVVATVVFAIVYAAVALGLYALRDSHTAVHTWELYVQRAGFWVPVVLFFLAYALIIAIVNRGGWWAYLLGSFFVGVIVYFAYIGGALLTVEAWKLTAAEAWQFVGTLWANPLTIASAIVAREVSLWFGGWIAARGRRVRARNLEARREYDRQLEAGATD